MTDIVRGSCHHDCPDTCGWEVTVADGRAVDLRGSVHHPRTAGQLCPKVNRFLDRVYHPDRILQPLIRTGPKGTRSDAADQFTPISWDEAIGLAANKLTSVPHPHGVLQFSFDGTQGVIQKGILADRFFDHLGASDIHRDLCGVTSYLGAQDVLGTPFGIDPSEIRYAKTILLWGTNTFHTNRHLWPTITAAQADGAIVVAVDPIRTPTAQRADHHIALRPGSDVMLVAALLHVLLHQNQLDEEWLTSHTLGWPELRAQLEALNLDDAAVATGVTTPTIRWLADRWANARPSVLRCLVGPEHQQNGREIMRSLAMLPSVTNAWNERGGGLSRSTQVYFETALNYPERPLLERRRRFNMASVGAALTDPTLDPPISVLMVHNANPAVVCPDQNQIVAGLERPDLFTIVVEQFMTDTARHADLILPATTQIEHLDLGIAWGHLHLSLNLPAIEPLGGALPNTEIFRRLASAVGLTDPNLFLSDEALIRDTLDSSHPWLTGISYETLRANGWQRLRVPDHHHPVGPYRLGPLNLKTPNGSSDPAALQLITRKQHIGFLNANYGSFPTHQPIEGQPLLTIHPIDAAERAINDGDTVTAANRFGSLTLNARISDRDTPVGVVTIPFGWWHGATPEHRSVNALTNPEVPGDGRGSAAFHHTFVTITRPETATPEFDTTEHLAESTPMSE